MQQDFFINICKTLSLGELQTPVTAVSGGYMHNHSARVRTRFSRQSFRFCFVKILVNPKGLTAFCAALKAKLCTRKFCDPKGADCGAILDAEREARLTPCEGDKFKSARRTRLLGVFVRVCYG